MKKIYLNDIFTIINGIIVQGDINKSIEHVTAAYRGIRKNTLYFNIYKKKNMNILINDEECIIVTEDSSKLEEMKNITLIKVTNIDEAYWNFVNYYRNLFKIPIVFVTGTCGKTTTKEMMKFILRKHYRVQATYKSDNGLCYNLKYLRGIDEKTQVAVFETGVAYPGDLKYYIKYFQPHIGVILNIGIDHLDRCKTLDNYINEKAVMLEALQNKGTLILNADDENIKKIDLSNYEGKIVYCGVGEQADFRALDIRYADGGMKFNLKYQNNGYELNIPAYIPGYGEHNVYNALAAIAATYHIGMGIKEAVKRLEYFKHIERHVEVCEGINGSMVIDDTWSTNPTSFEAALEVLSSLASDKKTIVVLGKMSLLGKSLPQWNEFVAEKIIEKGVDILVTIGDKAKQIGEVAISKGKDSNDVYLCNDAEEVYEVLIRYLDDHSIVLVKTSMLEKYGNLMEEIKK